MYSVPTVVMIATFAAHAAASSPEIALKARNLPGSESSFPSSVSRSATSSAATPSASVSPDDDDHEINQAINITMDGKIFPPTISANGFSM